MELDFIHKIIRSTLIWATACFVILSLYLNISIGLGIFLGALWGCANLLAIKFLIQNWLIPSPNRYLKLFASLTLKFPLIYYGGYLLLSSDFSTPLYLLLGFMLIFLALLTRGVKLNGQKATPLILFAISITANLNANLESDVPEVPNFITLLYKKFSHTPWATFLHEWESVIFSLLVAITISSIFYLGARNPSLIPSNLQNFLEWIVENFQNFAIEILGPGGEKFVPFLGTLFIYILSMNWMGLIPLMKAPSSNFSITIAMAICVFAFVQYLNIKNYGLLGFLYHMAGSPKDLISWILVPLIFTIELMTQITRPFTLALRLFGNVLGEDILIGAFALFGVTLLSYYGSVGLPLQIPFMFLGLLTGLMQALVFTLLSSIYILLSIPCHEEKISD